MRAFPIQSVFQLQSIQDFMLSPQLLIPAKVGLEVALRYPPKEVVFTEEGSFLQHSVCQRGLYAAGQEARWYK